MYDLCDIKTVKQLCKAYDFKLKKGLGQNFLINGSVLAQIVESGEVEGADCLEIGPGFGALTAELAKSSARVVAIEKDTTLMPVLKETLSEFQNVSVVYDDVLKLDLSTLINEQFNGRECIVVANLPYYITTPIFCYLLESELNISKIIIMVQEEVAERLCSPPGKKAYGAITVLTNFFGEPELLFKVPANNFFPAPKVNSAVIRVNLKKKNITDDQKLFFKVVRAAFANRRKTLANALKNSGFFNSEAILPAIRKSGFSDMVRGEELSVYEFAELAKNLSIE